MGAGGSSNYDLNQEDQICIYSQKRFSNQINVDWSFDTIFKAIGIFYKLTVFNFRISVLKVTFVFC